MVSFAKTPSTPGIVNLPQDRGEKPDSTQAHLPNAMQASVGVDESENEYSSVGPMLRFVVIFAVVAVLLTLGCDSGGSPPTAPPGSTCGGYPDWQTSPYVLPYPVGRAHRVSQGNCTHQSHQGTLRYSFDLEMPFGSVVTAARDGVVIGLRIGQPAGSRGLTASNWIQLEHADGIYSEYIHLEQFGNLVEIGDTVLAGDPIARTGDTGDVGSFPHVHFDLTPCGSNLACDTLPVTFRNTSPNPAGLVENVVYEALPYSR